MHSAVGASSAERGVRLVRRHERAEIAQLLADAFVDDPLSRWIYSDHPARLRWVAADFRLRLAQHGPDRQSFVDDALRGACVWAAPGQWRGHLRGQWRALLAMRRVLTNYERIGRMQRELDRRHPALPHYYLALLGVGAAHRRQGVAAALLAPTLAECDARKLPAYVEAGSEEAASCYLRHGFAVRGEVRVPAAPPVYLMWREPAA